MDSPSQVRATVRKLDTEDPFFYVVDLNVPGAALISPESVLDKFLTSNAAYKRVRELNGA